MTLTSATPMQDLSVYAVKLPHEEIDRLARLGIHQGSGIRVLQISDAGAVLVAVGDGRIALNRDTAKNIFVF